MAKDPAFLFYPGDWLGGTMAMSYEEKGIYITLLMLQFNTGHMTTHTMAQTVGQGFGQFWERHAEKFVLDSEGKYYNFKLDQEKNKRKAFVSSRYNNKEGKNQHQKDGGHMSNHMENEDNCINSSTVILPLISKEDLEKFRLKLMDDQILIQPLIGQRGIGSMSNLIAWIDIFNIHILGEGKAHKDYSDYKRHFKNWIMKQNTFGAPPQTTVSVKKMVV